ncbi:hypothetical protein [Bacillus weihaiensis]|nr:hypothetical protein [Bacillus weihaiensis]
MSKLECEDEGVDEGVCEICRNIPNRGKRGENRGKRGGNRGKNTENRG